MQLEFESKPDVLGRLCDAVLIAMAFLAVPTLAASLSRSGNLGAMPVMVFQVALAGVICIVALSRRRLPYMARAWFAVLAIASVGLTGIASFGLVAASGVWLPLAGVLAAVLIGEVAGGAVLLFVVLIAAVIGSTFVLGQDPIELDLVRYTTSYSGWAAVLSSWFMTGGIGVVAVAVMNRYFARAVAQSLQQAEALEQSQREYRDIFENMVDTVYRADVDGKILTISPSIVGMLGFRAEEVIGKKLTDFYANPGKREELVAQLQATNGDVRDFEAQMLDRNGEPQWISTNVRHWRDGQGSVLGVEGVARNITSYRAAEEALRRSQKMEALGHLTGGIAHDFNNLLSIVIGNADLLKEDFDESSSVRENADEIIKAAEQGSALTRRLLSFSRPEMLQEEPTAIDAVIRDLERMMNRTLGAVITLRLDLACGEACALIDSRQFETALLNLAINARDAMPNGGDLTITTGQTKIGAVAANSSSGLEQGEYLSVVVRDTGTGMTDETIRNAFEPFFTTKPLGTGNGLGLSMVFKFATHCGGHVSIDSKWGEGTSVTLLLPCSDEALKAPETPVQPLDLPRVSARILVVEDAPPLRAVAVATLEARGYEVLAAANGIEALDLLRNDTEIDLLFTDIVLPGKIDGYEISREALRIDSDVKILLTSGYALETPAKGDPVAEIPIVYKPYHRSQLLTKIEEILAGP